jgi:predicted GNAT family acetyltransferase
LSDSNGMAISALRRHSRRVERRRCTVEGVTITRHEDGGRGEYRARVEASDAIGRLTWVERGGARVADHTLVPTEIGNRGVAAGLVERMVADARAEGFRIRPQCSYVIAAFKRHPEWADVQA